MNAYLWVGLGGAIGSMARFAVSQAFAPASPDRWPTGTWLVNLLGCLLIGILWGLNEKMGPLALATRQLLMVGVLGGFTTFSAFSLESLQMWRSGQTTLMLLYIITSCLLGLLMTLLGSKLIEWMG